jgi:hypothetical protein
MKVEYLLIAFFLRELLYFYSTQKLINKLMSKNYHDYNFTKNIQKTMKHEPSLAEGLKAEDDLAEDLSPLQGFQGLN